MSLDDLLRRLEDLDPPSPEARFVLLWSYFETDGLATAENRARAEYLHPLDILPLESETPLKDVRAAGKDSDLLALRWLIALDHQLQHRSARRFDSLVLPGLNGEPYRLRRRNGYLAERFDPGVTWEADQSASLATYTRFHKAVPAEAIPGCPGVRIDCRPESSWGDRHLHLRLRQEREHLKVLMWPLELVLDYPVLDNLKAGTLTTFVSLDKIRNEEDLRSEVRRAIQTARELSVTLLIFPELAIPVDTEQEIRSTLADHGNLGHPVLTLFGRCHQRNATGDLDLNKAVLLGPDGSELHPHQKLTAFTGFSPDRKAHFGERLEVGDLVTVLECALGNLAPLICLDLIHTPYAPALRRSHANLFAVPSLSPETGAHRTAAKQLQVSNQASTFVSNRWIDGLSAEATSFYQVPRSKGYESHLPDPKYASYLLFELT